MIGEPKPTLRKQLAVHHVPYPRPRHTAYVSRCGRWLPERAVFDRWDGVTCGRCLRARPAAPTNR